MHYLLTSTRAGAESGKMRMHVARMKNMSVLCDTRLSTERKKDFYKVIILSSSRENLERGGREILILTGLT